MEKPVCEQSEVKYEFFKQKWQSLLFVYLPQYEDEIKQFAGDEDQGLRHSYEVFNRASELSNKINMTSDISIDRHIVESFSVFHDIGKFFQDLHSLENISIAETVFTEYAKNSVIDQVGVEAILDGIRNSDFYNSRLDPSGKPPSTLEGEIVRAADKMLDNLVTKVDRYWYKYGVPRNATFFDPTLSAEQRSTFSFDNFNGDQLNVILSIIGLKPEDFSHPILQEEYRQWSKNPKEVALQRIITLANDIGESNDNIQRIKDVIKWYREEFNC